MKLPNNGLSGGSQWMESSGSILNRRPEALDSMALAFLQPLIQDLPWDTGEGLGWGQRF